ncbi:MAG: Isopentenyl-diphosphate delta-isomerase [Candidatus Heimdallarchaeota archaeon LC_2]|nr:MAG: Isopentenyl-diphosphate delta-isomerase [Candidatus Heimdallarchaeota archaeon LC_2]
MESNQDDKFKLESRKAQHVKLVIDEDVSVSKTTNGFSLFDIVPRSIPDINYTDISLETEFLGRTFQAPVLIAGMTGGYPEAKSINLSLAKICSKLDIPMGVGSQRAMVVNPDMTPTFNVKEEYPDLFLLGNLGLVQFCLDFELNDYQTAQEKINADAMAIHINSFQELCQPEGDLNFKGAWSELENICKNSKVPVIGKEVGSGIAWEEVGRMKQIGCSAVDIGGSGGTSWAKIELMRNDTPEVPFELDDPTLRWGIPTAFATWEATEKTKVPIISTGGMYHGLMAAKAIAMGSTMVGIARPVLMKLIKEGEDAAEKWLRHYIETIKRVMFLMGVDSIKTLKTQKSRLIPTGWAREWLLQRKII